MKQTRPFILSASRRTDIPGFYTDWFMAQIKNGVFKVKHPFTKKERQIRVSPDLVHSIVFWSKNYEYFLKTKTGEKLASSGYRFYFNFTINSESSILEPGLPALDKRCEQLAQIADRFGPETIAWRFDPVCFYQDKKQGPEKSNLKHFPLIAQTVSSLGVKKCVTSFFDWCAKIDSRIKRLYKEKDLYLKFIDPPLEKKITVIRNMAKNLKSLGIKLHLCCEKDIFRALPPSSGIQQNACIDGTLLQSLFGPSCTLAKDFGQRAPKGCQCTKSVDIGSYDDHPCLHNCLFCYARPSVDTR